MHILYSNLSFFFVNAQIEILLLEKIKIKSLRCTERMAQKKSFFSEAFDSI